MASLDEDVTEIVAALDRLHEITCDRIPDWHRDHVRTLIDVGEYALAVDDIAGTFVEAGQEMPPEAAALLEWLASEMQMESDPEYESTARLRAQFKIGRT